MHSELVALLRFRESIIADHAWRDRDAAGHLDALKEVSEKISSWAAGHDQDIDARLRHYLANASFAKALTHAMETEPAPGQSKILFKEPAPRYVSVQHMKLFLMLLGMAVAGVAGYVMEPSLRTQLTGVESKGKTATISEAIDSILPQPGSEIDPSSLAPEQLPEKVTLSDEIKFSDASSGLTITVAAGSRAKLIRIDGKNAVVRPGDTAYTISLPIDKTDLMAQLAANPPSAVPPVQPTPAPEPEPAQNPAPTPTPAPAPAPEPAAEPAPAPGGDSQEPAPMPASEPAATPAPAVEPAAEPAPAPEPAPTPTPAPATTGTETDVVKIMQESIRSGQVKEFTFEQVLGWEPGTDETVDGGAFQTGTVSYKAETIFGVKTIQAKALISGGKVQRWIWPKSGMEIK